ncbi:MAG TPA: MaoC family dehydratase N-terminal domain-containing protein [Burkholderiaceae bacterium]|nr:MaoC family dehydratase N-terminal domain-containing protein [Burkholderiaceae bacterium]
MVATETSSLQTWIGRSEQTSDVITATPPAALAATLDHDPRPWHTGDELPELWHWLFFLPLHPQREIGPDGHARRGGFLPPVQLPRRMWAGSRFVFHQPLAVGESVLRTSTIDDVSEKSGRSGALVFVRVRHDVAHEGGVALTEEHDIVYREAPRADAPAIAPQRAPTDETFARTIEPDPVLLFRYSALTFNGHRIHYDRDYCRDEEGYPGLVVHGPLIATLLVDLLHRHRPDARLRRFAFKAVRPIFDIAPFEVCGRIADDGHAVRLWARDHEGWLAMEATAEI